MVEEAHTSALKILRENKETLEKLAQTLLVEETLDGEAVDAIVAGKPLPPKNRQAKSAAPPETPTPAPENEPAPPAGESAGE